MLLAIVQGVVERTHRLLIAHTIHDRLELVFLSLANALQLLQLVRHALIRVLLLMALRGGRIIRPASGRAPHAAIRLLLHAVILARCLELALTICRRRHGVVVLAGRRTAVRARS